MLVDGPIADSSRMSSTCFTDNPWGFVMGNRGRIRYQRVELTLMPNKKVPISDDEADECRGCSTSDGLPKPRQPAMIALILNVCAKGCLVLFGSLSAQTTEPPLFDCAKESGCCSLRAAWAYLKIACRFRRTHVANFGFELFELIYCLVSAPYAKLMLSGAPAAAPEREAGRNGALGEAKVRPFQSSSRHEPYRLVGKEKASSPQPFQDLYFTEISSRAG